jgi:hypothetical protein
LPHGDSLHAPVILQFKFKTLPDMGRSEHKKGCDGRGCHLPFSEPALSPIPRRRPVHVFHAKVSRPDLASSPEHAHLVSGPMGRFLRRTSNNERRDRLKSVHPFAFIRGKDLTGLWGSLDILLAFEAKDPGSNPGGPALNYSQMVSVIFYQGVFHHALLFGSSRVKRIIQSEGIRMAS